MSRRPHVRRATGLGPCRADAWPLAQLATRDAPGNAALVGGRRMNRSAVTVATTNTVDPSRRRPPASPSAVTMLTVVPIHTPVLSLSSASVQDDITAKRASTIGFSGS